MNAACELLARLVVAVAWDVLDATVLPVVDRVVCRISNASHLPMEGEGE